MSSLLFVADAQQVLPWKTRVAVSCVKLYGSFRNAGQASRVFPSKRERGRGLLLRALAVVKLNSHSTAHSGELLCKVNPIPQYGRPARAAVARVNPGRPASKHGLVAEATICSTSVSTVFVGGFTRTCISSLAQTGLADDFFIAPNGVTSSCLPNLESFLFWFFLQAPHLRIPGRPHGDVMPTAS